MTRSSDPPILQRAVAESALAKMLWYHQIALLKMQIAVKRGCGMSAKTWRKETEKRLEGLA
jgi:hypothetical protein